ncbi:MAG: TIR domain-containing protein [Zoogloea sp.]|nr:TIR domain-containing protein [Zoogloea sp.]
MARKIFYSFHYVPDNWRASQVRNVGVVEGNQPAKDNDWETVKRGGDAAIQRWIDGQLEGRSCAVVLIGTQTAGRKWITYEINKAWNDGKGVVGIYVHNLKDVAGEQSKKGANPLDYVTFKSTGAKLSTVAKTYDPPYTTSTNVYNHIKENLSAWIEEAIKIRNAN